jgi:hypothetical protein
MKRTYLACLALAGVFLAAGFLASGAARAGIIEDFQFNDANGTALNAAVNSASTHLWVHDSDHAATIQVQGGSLNIVKNNTDFVTEGLGFDDITTGVLWMVAEFKDWAVLGTAPDGNNVEEIRFGFMGTEDLTPPPSSTVMAEMMLARNHGAGKFQLSATALGTAGTNIAPMDVNFVQTNHFVMAMKVDQSTNKYSLHYKDGANPFVKVGDGNLEPTRDAIVVRFSVNNFWGDVSGEQANLDRFYISDTAPVGIPEPTSALLVAVAAACAVAVRRR